jgi:4-alpha-glucanotransferase
VHSAAAIPRAWAIADGYHDISGRWVEPDPATVEAILESMRPEAAEPPPSGTVFVHQGEQLQLSEPHELTTEDGAVLTLEQSTPRELQLGYHTLRRLGDGRVQRLVVAPHSCYLPEELRGWGWAVQLYAVRSSRSWGIGDLGDLGELGRWSRSRLGARTLLLNPLHAPLPIKPQEPSPYFPSSRRYRNPLYIRIEDVPGAARLGERLAPLAAAARQLNELRRLDRDRVFDLKMSALQELFVEFPRDHPEFAAYRAAEGPGLSQYAAFCLLTERCGGPWQSWPEELRRPDHPAVAAECEQSPERVLFHEWLQWLLERQLRAAAGTIDLITDLAVGARGDGADAWIWQDTIARGVTAGAPPDPFNAAGQDWGLPPFDPWRLAAAGYEPFIQTVRAALRGVAGLRVDHVMGLFRLYWIPESSGPAAGAYVRYPHRELLDILALESVRARAYVIGEDLGTVEDFVRDELSRRRIMSYRLLWFEDRPAREFPIDSMAAVTTHDLPTVAGVWEGSDSHDELHERLRRHARLEGDATTEQAAEAVHRALSESPSRLLVATLEDALGVSDRANRPGTTDEWPNWGLALPTTLEQIMEDPRPERLARVLARG